MKLHVRVFLSLAIAVVFASVSVGTAWADEVTDWNQIMFQAALVAKTSPLDMGRNVPRIWRSPAMPAANSP